MMTRVTVFYSNNAYIGQEKLSYVKGGRKKRASLATGQVRHQGEKHKHWCLEYLKSITVLISIISFNQSSLVKRKGLLEPSLELTLMVGRWWEMVTPFVLFVSISEAVSLWLLPQGKFLGPLLYRSLEQFLFGVLSSRWFGNNITEGSNTILSFWSLIGTARNSYHCLFLHCWGSQNVMGCNTKQNKKIETGFYGKLGSLSLNQSWRERG